MELEQIIGLVRRRLEESNRSAWEVSRKVAGHPKAVKRLLEGRVPTASRLFAILKELDLEIHVDYKSRGSARRRRGQEDSCLEKKNLEKKKNAKKKSAGRKRKTPNNNRG